MVGTQDFGGINIAYQNPMRAEVSLNMSTIDEDGNIVFRESFYTSQADSYYSFRGYDPIPTVFIIYVEDKWGNQTATRSFEITPLEDIFLDTVCVTTDRKTIAPKSINQKLYIDAIRKNDIVFGVGPAGTGKTYLAVAAAVATLNLKKVKRIILTRPAVEAGEKLGFLPGDLNEKVDPYLKPLFDALNDMLDFDTVSRLMDKQIIEIAPLAFMRGRTLNDAFIILDEAQNTTSSQMKMFLTRIGFNSKCIVTGDVTQVDLDKNIKSGLIDAQSILKDIEGISFCSFNEMDVVRHSLVRKIIEAYK